MTRYDIARFIDHSADKEIRNVNLEIETCDLHWLQTDWTGAQYNISSIFTAIGFSNMRIATKLIKMEGQRNEE